MALDQVNIGDIARIKGRDVKALYIVGVNDGVLPSTNKEEGILSDRDRIELRELGIIKCGGCKSGGKCSKCNCSGGCCKNNFKLEIKK